MKKLKVITVVGTRPEIIRLSRVIARLDEYCNHILVHTGQNYDYELNEIFFDDLCFSNLSSSQKTQFRLQNISLVFQSHNLLKDFNVNENIILPLMYKGLSKKQAKKIASESLEHVNMTNHGTSSISTLSGIFKKSWLGYGPLVKEFETKFAKYIGTKYAIGVNSGTAALHLSLLCNNFLFFLPLF